MTKKQIDILQMWNLESCQRIQMIKIKIHVVQDEGVEADMSSTEWHKVKIFCLFSNNMYGFH